MKNTKERLMVVKAFKKKVIKRKRVSPYWVIFKKLKKIWAISNYSCGQRLTPMIPTYLDSLKRHKELMTTKGEKELLLKISPATVNRLLKHERRKITLKARSRTKPGSLLKSQVPIRTWLDWNNASIGFLEIDSVHHCGISNYGEYLYSLDTTDVKSGWNECAAHMGKSEKYTIEALEIIKKRLPFTILGIDFDTGGEFVNYHLIRYCTRNKITYTRAREAVKNDQPYVEQQNYTVVRKYVGYQRLDTWEQLALLNQLYEKLSDYQNFFQAVMRLKNKVKAGARTIRKYGKTMTAYQRLMASNVIDKIVKQKLKQRYLKLNPKKLILELTILAKKLSKIP